MIPQRRPARRPRRLQPGEADFIVRQIANRGDAIGFGPDGTVYVLAALDRAWFDRLCAYGADREDMEDSDQDDDRDNDTEAVGWGEPTEGVTA